MKIKRFTLNIYKLLIVILFMSVLLNFDLFAIGLKLKNGVINYGNNVKLSDLVVLDKNNSDYRDVKSILSRELQVSDKYITVLYSENVRKLLEDNLNEPLIIIGKHVVLAPEMYNGYDSAIEMLVREIENGQNDSNYGENGRGFSLKIDFISSELKGLKKSEITGMHIVSLNRDNASFLAYVIYERGQRKGLLGKISYRIDVISRNEPKAKKEFESSFTYQNKTLGNGTVQVVLRHRGISITTDGYIVEKLTGNGVPMVRVRLKTTGKVFSGYLVTAGEVLIEMP